ncbi:MAG: lytic murein transglycosylase [Pseudomonadota bacterium]
MTLKHTFLSAVATAVIAASVIAPAAVGVAYAKCSDSAAGFATFKKEFAQYARSQGVGKRGLAALGDTYYSKSVIKFDRAQRKSFRKGFDAFYKLRTTGLARPARKQMKKHAKLLARVERKYGVPKEVLVTIWGMETAFGYYSGKYDIVTSLATLTHDCRRTDFFRPNLLAALQIIDNGWMPRSQMKGARHGEIGQTQFMAKNYVKFGVDYNGDGRRDLVASISDVMASTANYLKAHGWRAGEPYGEGTHNFRVLNEWNAATVYQKAIAKFASSL